MLHTEAWLHFAVRFTETGKVAEEAEASYQTGSDISLCSFEDTTEVLNQPNAGQRDFDDAITLL